MKLNSKYFVILILILIILLSTFYSEGMSAYVMKNAFIQTDNGAGRLTTIDTDGNFSNVVSNVDVSTQKNNFATTPVTTTTPYSSDINKKLSTDSNIFSINIDSNTLNDIESQVVSYVNNHPEIINKIEQIFSDNSQPQSQTIQQQIVQQQTVQQQTVQKNTTQPQTTKPKNK